ncbi:3095_t:CDS:2 [Acaulospora colombiana]|uniref:3095_t:CDS:1 n=1 Tax=Acaulospora colombiana TaxID=27376 RepID=A0ACA9NRW2_9GLOM|nr:3095_t:CDS:2 [Acaulospora colombiana]
MARNDSVETELMSKWWSRTRVKWTRASQLDSPSFAYYDVGKGINAQTPSLDPTHSYSGDSAQNEWNYWEKGKKPPPRSTLGHPALSSIPRTHLYYSPKKADLPVGRYTESQGSRWKRAVSSRLKRIAACFLATTPRSPATQAQRQTTRHTKAGCLCETTGHSRFGTTHPFGRGETALQQFQATSTPNYQLFLKFWTLIKIQQQPQQPPEEALTFRILNRNFDKQDLQNLIVGAKQDYQQEIANIRAELVSKREMLVAQVAELDNQIRMRIAEAKETYRLVEEEMKRKIRALEEENLKDRNVMALRKLPIEIMGTIFAECVKILDMSPRVLALVCKFWYNVAIKTPTLWNRLMITNDPEVYWLTHRAKGRRPADLNAPVFGSAARPMGSGTRSLSATQICTDINELTSALKRAGNAKLDVTIAFGDNMISPTLGQKYMYEHLFTEDVSKRIARLEVVNELG